MSYCRWGDDSDVYAYACDKGWMVHYNGGDKLCTTLPKFKAFMNELKSKGQKIPDYTFQRIEEETLDEATNT